MATVYVCFWFDVEDYITPESDQALKRLLQLFRRQGLQATWKLVGEKLRVLERRGRRDIVELLRGQDVGYHTDFHSRHPTPAEYLRPLGWDEGAQAFKHHERAGFDDLVRILGRTPSCYGQPGDSWGPQSYATLTDWGIPVYLDECYQVGLNDQPFWYAGMLNVLRLRSNCTRMPLGVADGLDQGKARFTEIHERLRPAGGLISIYYHPCEWATTEFWDAVNFAKGANPPRERWQRPALKPPLVAERDLVQFSAYLRWIAALPDVRLVTAGEMEELYADQAAGREFTPQDLLDLSRGMEQQIGYAQTDSIALSPAELLRMMVGALTEFVRAGRLPEAVPNRGAAGFFGPKERGVSRIGDRLDGAALRDTVRALQRELEAERCLPAAFLNGTERLSLAACFAACRAALEHVVADGEWPATLPGREPELALEQQVPDDYGWGWVIHPEGFQAPELLELGRLQTWTMKPAML